MQSCSCSSLGPRLLSPTSLASRTLLLGNCWQIARTLRQSLQDWLRMFPLSSSPSPPHTLSVGVCSWPANYEALAQSHLTGRVMKLAHYLWAMVSSPSLPSSPLSPPPVTQSKEKMSEVVIRHVFQALIHSVACLHSMLDPQEAWKECFLPASPASKGGKEGPSVLPAPAELVPLFLSVLTQSQVPLHFNLCLQLYSDLRNELLHMIGALLSSVEVMKSSHYCCVSKLFYTEQCTKRCLVKSVSTTTDLSRPPRKHLPASDSRCFHGDQGHPRSPLPRP